MTKPSKFWEWIAKRYARTPIADEAVYQKKLEVTQGYLQPDMNVLEFGSGTGSTAILHAPHVKKYLAIDSSKNMTEIAKAKIADGRLPNLVFELSGIDEFDAPTASFDAILGLSILHLLEDMDGAIEKAHRLLKPGGVFVTSTACIGDMKSVLASVMPLAAPIGRVFGVLPYLKILTVAELELSLTNAGFRIDHQWHPGEDKGVFIVSIKG